VSAWLKHPDTELLDQNHAISSRYFNVADLPGRIAAVLDGIGVGFA
jgi:hypothetical protein